MSKSLMCLLMLPSFSSDGAEWPRLPPDPISLRGSDQDRVRRGRSVRADGLDLHDHRATTVPDSGAEAPVVEGVDERVIRRRTLDQTQPAKAGVLVLADADRVVEVGQTAGGE